MTAFPTITRMATFCMALPSVRPPHTTNPVAGTTGQGITSFPAVVWITTSARAPGRRPRSSTRQSWLPTTTPTAVPATPAGSGVAGCQASSRPRPPTGELNAYRRSSARNSFSSHHT
jgi:hypothetical protein